MQIKQDFLDITFDLKKKEHRPKLAYTSHLLSPAPTSSPSVRNMSAY